MSSFGAWHPVGECRTCGSPIWAKAASDDTPPDTKRTCACFTKAEAGPGLPPEVRLAILRVPAQSRGQLTTIAGELIAAGVSPKEVADRIAVGESPPDV